MSGKFVCKHQLQLNAITSIPMIFKTNNTERMRIDASGNIGLQNGAYIGTTSSSHAITVQGGAGNRAAAYGLGGNGDNDLRFSTNNSERMRITSSGEALIGTTSGGNVVGCMSKGRERYLSIPTQMQTAALIIIHFCLGTVLTAMLGLLQQTALALHTTPHPTTA